ncbi:MAG: hypothetical protein IT426_06370 [Pirellulales bacterium]|nr:hypothetical protein [Pirellulales bacterium]
MIKNPAILEAFEQKLTASHKADPAESMRIFEELHRFAFQLGKFSRANPLEGIETVIRLASILRSVKRAP